MDTTAHHVLSDVTKERLVKLGTIAALLGLGLLAIALSASSYVVTQVLFSSSSAAIICAGIAGLSAVTWFVVPLAARMRPPETAPPSP